MSLAKVILLLKRNALMKKRNLAAMIMAEMLLPIIFFSIVVVVSSVMSVDNHAVEDMPLPVPLSVPSALEQRLSTGRLLYAPQNCVDGVLANDSDVELLIRSMQEHVSPDVHSQFVQLNTEKEMEDAYESALNASPPDRFFAGLVFDSDCSGQLLADTAYALRMDSANLADTAVKVQHVDDLWEFEENDAKYHQSGFLDVQAWVDSALLDMHAKRVGNVNGSFALNVTYSKFPRPEWTFDPFYKYMAQWAGLYVIIGFVSAGSQLSGAIVMEKETRTKIYMQSMGVTESVFWTAWYLTYSVILLVPVVIITVLEAAVRIFKHTNSGWLLLLLLLFVQSFIWMCFALSTLFSKSKSASSGVTVLLFVLYAPFYIPVNSAVAAAFVCLSPPVAFGYGFQALFDADNSGSGISWSNMTGSDDTVLGFGWCMLMLLLDFALLALLTGYLALVLPSEVGVARPWHFPVSWLCKRRQEARPINVVDSRHHADFEPVSEELQPYVSIRNLTKSFPVLGQKQLRPCQAQEEFNAVDGLTLDCYKGQILALLGHNGAGKTTTISILTGLLPPTNGSVTVNGQSLWQHLDAIRADVGVCPQFDVLFDSLTTREHLEFYGALKGVPPEQVQDLVDTRLETLDLHEHEHTIAKKMSGGQRRKLSVLIAMIGEPTVLILDEPTSGMDPYSRRKLWNLLHSYKKDRVMILTTHFMDEADLLGDRVAIMSKGQLRCVGSSMFLKKRFGVGYHLDVSSTPDCTTQQETRLAQLVKDVVPDADVDDGNQRSFVLPLSSVERFSGLFRALEEDKRSLGVAGYGVSLTSLEEVFLHLAEEEDAKAGGERTVTEDVEEKTEERHSTDLELKQAGEGMRDSLYNLQARDINDINATLTSIVPSRWQQFRGQVVKKFRTTKRDPGTLWLQIFFPVLYVVLVGVTSGNYSPPISTLKPLSFTPPFSLLADSLCAVGGNQTANVPLVDALQTVDDLHSVAMAPFASITTWQKWILDAYDDRQEVYMSAMADTWAPDYAHVAVAGNRSTAHATPTLLNAVSRAAARQFNSSIETENRPLPSSESFTAVPVESWVVPMMLGLAFLLGCMGYGVALVKEVATRSKHQQLVMGLSPMVYWAANLVFDVGCFLVTIVLCLALLLAMNLESLVGKNTLGTAVLLVVYVFSMLCLCYLIALPFSNPNAFQGAFMFAGMLLGLGLYSAALSQETPGESNPMASAILWYPPFGLMWGFNKLVLLHYSRPADSSAMDALEWDRLGSILLAMTLFGLACLVLAVLVDLGKLRRAQLPMKGTPEAYEKEEDVARESVRVRDEGCDDAIRMVDVVKAFPKLDDKTTDKVVVNNVTMGIPTGEVFGLLGPNGAGKTTTMRMLTAEHSPSSGLLQMKGKRVPQQVHQVYPQLGFCPQDEGLVELLTAREHLELYASIKGVPQQLIPRVVNTYLETMQLTPHSDKLSKAYSGGNKRKLNVAISLMGAPAVLLLDEPSTGIDPQARRQLWDAILAGSLSRACVLTTHSMEEADALCNRIGIMVNGKLQCVGTSQHLKSKYGQGYEVEVKLSTEGQQGMEDVTRALEEIASEHQGHVVPLEQFGSQLKLSVRHNESGAPIPLWMLFLVLEERKAELNVVDYSISQTTLEQVFLRFAHHQEEEDQ